MTNPKQIIERLASKIPEKCECGCGNCCANCWGMPVYIGDVLEKLSRDYHKDLLILWGSFKFTKSLQQIEEESGYGCDCFLKYENWEKTCICKDTVTKKLKSPQARELFEFLDPITK